MGHCRIIHFIMMKALLITSILLYIYIYILKLIFISSPLNFLIFSIYRKQFTTFISNFPQTSKNYLLSLFPIISWLPRYNATWLYGDLIAGLIIS